MPEPLDYFTPPPKPPWLWVKRIAVALAIIVGLVVLSQVVVLIAMVVSGLSSGR